MKRYLCKRPFSAKCSRLFGRRKDDDARDMHDLNGDAPIGLAPDTCDIRPPLIIEIRKWDPGPPLLLFDGADGD